MQIYPKKIFRNILFPNSSDFISLHAKSTFDKELNIEVPVKKGNSNELLELITFNMKINKGITKKLLEFKINPH